MTDEISVGVLGVGHIGTVHLQSARVIDGVSVAAVADAVPENRELAERLGAPKTYADYEELLAAEDVDAVVVALPPFLHAEAAERATEAGCHVFLEKPLARTAAEGREVIKAAEAADVSLGVDHTLRYQPDMVRLKEQFDSGATGHVPLCYVSRVNSGPFESPPATHEVPTWQLDPEATGGGAVMDLGVHLLDLLVWFFGDMEVRHAELERQLDLDYEDTASVTLKSTETGTVATLNCGYFQWEEPPDVNMTVRLDGVAGTVQSEDYVPNFYLNAGRSAVENVLKRLGGASPDYFEPSYYYQAHYAALEDFLTAVREGREPPVSGEDGLRALELVEEVYAVADSVVGREDGEVVVDRDAGADASDGPDGGGDAESDDADDTAALAGENR